MTFTSEQVSQLSSKLDIANVKTRDQAGRTLSYIEGWHAESEANRIFGYDGWSRQTVYCREVCRYETKSRTGNMNWKVGYEAMVRVEAGGIIREGTGHGNGTMSDLYDCIESAAKEAETDAMKRALKTFGNPFGLALYDKTQENVDRTTPEQRAKATPPPDVDQTTVIVLMQAFEAAKTLEDIDSIWKRCKAERDALKIKLPGGFKEVSDAAAKQKKKLTPQKDA